MYIRFADALLWKAEAYNETGKYPEAIALINSIRQRARTGVAMEVYHLQELCPTGMLLLLIRI